MTCPEVAVPFPYQILLLVIAELPLYTPFKGVPVTVPVNVSPLIVVAAKFVVPATFRFPVMVSLPEIALLVMLVAAKVEAPLTFKVPGVARVLKVLMLLVNCYSCVGCPVRLA